MPAIATFDPGGSCISVSVCEGATCPLVRAAGVRWGRWAEEPEPGDAELAGNPALTELRRELGPHLAERLSAGAVATRPLELVSDDAMACVFLAGSMLLSLRTKAGFTSLLFEAGDWVHLPAGVPHVFDAGEAAGLAWLRLSAGPRGWFPWRTGRCLPPGLPTKDAFVDHLLVALGQETEDDA